MPENALAKGKPGPATQRFLDITEVRDDLIILKDGTVRAVMLVSSINFALKSSEEQEAIIQAYMTFLNSLEYPIQIVIQSRKMNIDGYLNSLQESSEKSTNELLRAQIADYRAFVSELVVLGEIMQKRFYIVLPYNPISNKQKKFFDRLGEAFSPTIAAKLNEKQLIERREQLTRRCEILAGQLASMSLQAVRLDTQGLIELFYNAYNPDVYDEQKMMEMDKIQLET